MLYILLIHSIYALTYTIGKLGVLCAEPFFFLAVRMLMSGLLFMGYAYFVQKKPVFKRKTLNYIFANYISIAFFLFYLGYAPDYAVLEYVDSGKWALLFTLSPLFIALFSYFQCGEKITKKQLLGISIGFLGVLPVLYKDEPIESLLGSFYFISIPEFFILFSVISYAYGMTLMRRKIGHKNEDIILLNGISMFIAGLLLLLTSICFDTWTPLPIYDYRNFSWTIAAIIGLHIFVYGVNGYLMKWYTATFLTFLGFIDPCYTAVYGWFFLGETISFHFIFSLITIFIGLYIFYQDELGV